ncbi:MAG: hypothetical protein AB7E05_09205 [Sphingobium sp.]
MMQRRPNIRRPDCTCADCRAATRMFRLILIGSAIAWALIITALLAPLA